MHAQEAFQAWAKFAYSLTAQGTADEHLMKQLAEATKAHAAAIDALAAACAEIVSVSTYLAASASGHATAGRMLMKSYHKFKKAMDDEKEEEAKFMKELEDGEAERAKEQATADSGSRGSTP